MKFICLSYAKGLSEKVYRVCIPFRVKAAFKTYIRTMRQNLMKVKTHALEEKKAVVYEVTCKDCSKAYIDETKRMVRLGEHKQVASDERSP